MSEPQRDDPAASSGRIGPRELRVSDAEREHVVGILETAIGQGLLSLDEFTSRTDTALAARTRGQLNVVLADLPGLRHRDAARQRSDRGAEWNSPVNETPGYLELTAHGSALKRSGRWVVPSRLLVRTKYGETNLDFTEAQHSDDVLSVELDCKWGPVTLTVPDGASVDTTGITEVKWGSINERTNSAHTSGIPHYVISGRVHGGQLTIRNPRRGFLAT